MTGTGQGAVFSIIIALDIDVRYHDAQRGSGSIPIINAADDLKTVGFPAGGGNGTKGTAQGKLTPDERIVYSYSGRQAVKDGAHCRAVAFAKDRNSQIMAKGVLHSCTCPFVTKAIASRRDSGAACSTRQLPTLSTRTTLIQSPAVFLSCSIAR